uniref:Uncharacterized protein n=1 Tax=Musca domestica TaxID=7370 RepID=A0A1I8N3Y2_MUSDO
MSKSQINGGLPTTFRRSKSGIDSNLPKIGGSSSNIKTANHSNNSSINTTSTATTTKTTTTPLTSSAGVSSVVGVTPALECPPPATAKDQLSVNRLSAGGNASSAPGPGGTSSSPDVEAMREWCRGMMTAMIVQHPHHHCYALGKTIRTRLEEKEENDDDTAMLNNSSFQSRLERYHHDDDDDHHHHRVEYIITPRLRSLSPSRMQASQSATSDPA